MPAPERITEMPVILEPAVSDVDLFELVDLDSPDNVKLSVGTLKLIMASFSVFEVSASLDAVANNTSLRHGAVLTNQTPIVFPFDVRLIALAAATGTVKTWDLELRTGGVLIPGALLSTAADTKASVTGLVVDIAALTEIEVFANGAGIQRPSATMFFARRT